MKNRTGQQTSCEIYNDIYWTLKLSSTTEIAFSELIDVGLVLEYRIGTSS